MLLLFNQTEGTASPLATKNHTYEVMLYDGLEALRHNRLEEALEKIGDLTRQQPDFRLAQLIYGDLLMAHASPIRRFGNTNNKELREDLDNLLDEARARLGHLLSPPDAETLPGLLWQLPRENAFAIVIDLSKSRLYLFRNDPERPRLVLDFYISSGKNGTQKFRNGDKRTPMGVYFVGERFPKEKLTDFYGAGALPINYPNEWDRLQRRTGYGIWLHGTPLDTYSRPPRASDGCVALSNDAYQLIEGLAGIGTPVIIGEKINWLSPQEWQEDRQAFMTQLAQWTKLWQGRDVEGVLASYAPDFHNLSRNVETWKREIRWVLTAKPEKGGDLSEYAVLGYPGPSPMVLVSYGVTGEEAASGTVRRQLWRQDSNKKDWQIVFEELG